MIIKSIRLRNFRNYRGQAIELGARLNFFVGDNAQGKTNILESVYLACLGRSPRTPRDRELIFNGAESAEVSIRTEGVYGSSSIDIQIDRKNNKRIAINGIPIKRLGELMGTATCVYFSPDELKIVKDSPAERRKMLDIALCQISRTYFYLLANYNKVLAQRNKLLKSGDLTLDSLEIWTNQLIEYGSKIIRTRSGMVKRLSELAEAEHAVISGGRERLSLIYESVAGESVAEIRESLARAYRADRERDIRVGYTNSGAHKDDVRIMVGSTDVRSYGSQGQQRSAALSIKLAELVIIGEERGDNPILILDDVFSELDTKRRDNLIKRLKDIQTLISCTDLPPMTKDTPPTKTHQVIGGRIK